MRRLQEFGFEKSAYERPNQTWICGRAREGKCCLAGPDAKGHCTATTECLPLRKGDRWVCTRPSFLGGPCPEGPWPDGQCCRTIPKCTPIRSLRSWRGLTVLLMVAATMVGVLLTIGSIHGNRVISPGQLSFSHNSVGNDCSQCHGPLEGRPAGWLGIGSGALSAHQDSQLCLNCHNTGESPLQPHSLPPARLESLKQASLKKNKRGSPPAGLILASFIDSPGQSGKADLACATCHQEHRGSEADLKKLTNQQCQGCHATQFASLADGHPAFTHYPFTRRTRIIFDHESHFETHFKDAAKAKFAPVSCMDCHQTDLRGGTMLVKPFQEACASCHDDQIKGLSAVKTGIPFISLPQLDDGALKGDYAIGEWPEDADQPLIPFLRVLLSSDPPVREAMAKLEKVDLSKLPATNAVVLKAAQTVAWGVKSLIFDLETGGQEELVKRITLGAGRPLTDSEKEGLVAFLSVDTLSNTFRTAFPDLQKEVLDYRKTGKGAATQMIPSPPLAGAGPVKVAAPAVWVSQGGWFSPDQLTKLLYHPRGHADRFIRSWMSLTVNADHTADAADARMLFKDLSAPTSVGLCSKCHSIDDTPVRQVNWTVAPPDPMEHGFNRFSHSAHMSLLDTRGCLRCHSLNRSDSQSKDTYAAAFEPGHNDPSNFHSNFQPINKGVCADCHQPRHVRDDCLLCHNYHVGRFEPIVPHAKLVSLVAPGAK